VYPKKKKTQHIKDFWENFDPNPPDLEGKKILECQISKHFPAGNI
jgi:hypothetical protein